MADEILEELWKIKDELSEKSRKMGWSAYAEYLNETIQVRGAKLMTTPLHRGLKVAEEADSEYTAKKEK